MASNDNSLKLYNYRRNVATILRTYSEPGLKSRTSEYKSEPFILSG